MNKDDYLIFEAYLKENAQPVCKTDADVSKRWYINGKCHREDGPAIERANGSKSWYINGKCHREDGPAAEYADGSKYWYIQGKQHREDGPAIEYADGDKFWYQKGNLHRDDGPAVEYPAHKEYFYYLDGKNYDEDIESWAKAVLRQRGSPNDPDAVKTFIRSILQKQLKDLI